jgi:hypothetical protein
VDKFFCPECDASFSNRFRMLGHKMDVHAPAPNPNQSIHDRYGYVPGSAIEEPWGDD